MINNMDTMLPLRQLKNVQRAYQKIQTNSSQKQSAGVKILARKTQAHWLVQDKPWNLPFYKDIVRATHKSNASLVQTQQDFEHKE